jgi:hypothetical protein
MMTLPPTEPSRQPTSVAPPTPKILKFSKKQLVLAFAIAGISDAIGAFATPLPPVVWMVDLGTALLLFIVLGRQWLLLPGLALEAISGLGGVSIMAAGGWGHCYPGHSSPKFWTAVTNRHFVSLAHRRMPEPRAGEAGAKSGTW